MRTLRTLILVCLFATAFAFVESSVVMYLRQAYYPQGFSFPLRPSMLGEIVVELVREAATIIMLVAVAILAGKNPWQRSAFFLIAFGVWDIFYYIWLKVILGWPASIFEWDVLFLIPWPWIGPVIAPVLVSLAMIGGGILILRQDRSERPFRPSRVAIALSLLGTVIILASFLLDLDASMRFQAPKPYRYELLALGMVCYAAAFLVSMVRHNRPLNSPR